MNLGYLALVVPGLAAASLGFVLMGRKRFHGVAAGALFAAGVAALVLGVLLACVPGFFG